MCAVPQSSCTSLHCDSYCGTVTSITSFSGTLVMAALYFIIILLPFAQKILVLCHLDLEFLRPPVALSLSNQKLYHLFFHFLFFFRILYWHGVIQMVFLMVSNRRWQSNKLPLSSSRGNIGAVCWNVSDGRTWVLDM